MKIILLGIHIVALVSCQAPAEKTKPTLPVDDTIPERIRVETPNPFEDSLKAYFDFPLDFYAAKKEARDMLDGYSKAFKEESAHKVDDPEALFYCYWNYAFDAKQVPVGRSLIFATWKPWKTAKQRYYETDNETLVGIESRIKWDGLKRSNFVGLKMHSVQTRFGQPMHTRNDCALYYQEDKILILHQKGEKIDWFRYYWMNAKIENPDSLSEALFVW
ncbi:MAG: hypothetical protein HYZ14_19740 [Bacteroidetes bacterium]|nr:hypothetical protein [Bacteroidota bacterium]